MANLDTNDYEQQTRKQAEDFFIVRVLKSLKYKKKLLMTSMITSEIVQW